MVETKLELPTKEYDVKLDNKEFTVKPLSEDCVKALTQIEAFGGEVKSFPNKEKPTAVFVNYKPKHFPKTEQYNYTVVGMEMSLHLGLLFNHKDFKERLLNFIDDMEVSYEKPFPTKFKEQNKRRVQVINTYKY